MKYVCEIEINIPVEKVVDFWSDETNFPNWQDGFISIELLEGNWNVEGSKSKILFKNGKQKMELIETVISNNLPFSKKALYEHIHMSNTQLSRFEKISDTRSKIISEVEYTHFNGFMPKMMATFFTGMFKRQSQKWLDQFKIVVEKS